MAYYNYKRVANRADFISATVEWSEQTGEEFEGTADYDGDVYCVAEFLLDKKDEEIARLRDELAEYRQDAERYRWLRRARMNVDVLVREDEDSVWLDMHGNDLDVYVDAALRGEE